MHRRALLLTAGKAAGCFGMIGAIGAFHWGKKAYARHELASQLISSANSVLLPDRSVELREIPAAARAKIQTWFQAPCVNAREFAVHVTSAEFRAALYRSTDDETKRLHFLGAFLRHVTSDLEILNQVRVIAEEAGARLDTDWQTSCTAISRQWGVHITEYRAPTANEPPFNVELLVTRSIQHSLMAAAATKQGPLLSETTDKIGKSAMLLLPLISLPKVTVPLFVVVAVGHLYAYFVGLTGSPEKDVQAAISAQLALLGNRIGAELEADLRANVSRLHSWQDHALRSAAILQAAKTVG